MLLLACSQMGIPYAEQTADQTIPRPESEREYKSEKAIAQRTLNDKHFETGHPTLLETNQRQRIVAKRVHE